MAGETKNGASFGVSASHSRHTLALGIGLYTKRSFHLSAQRASSLPSPQYPGRHSARKLAAFGLGYANGRTFGAQTSLLKLDADSCCPTLHQIDRQRVGLTSSSSFSNCRMLRDKSTRVATSVLPSFSAISLVGIPSA